MHSVRELIQAKPARLITADPQNSVAQAMQILKSEAVHSVLVIREGALVGIMTDKDYLRKVVAVGRSAEDLRVEDIMTRSVYTVDIDATLQHCISLMADHTLHHLPVFEDGKLKGLVSWTDLMEHMLSEGETPA